MLRLLILLLITLGLFPNPGWSLSSETDCLATILWNESRGEDLDDNLMVASVVMNRKTHPEFPDTICGVVTEPNQFAASYAVMNNRYRELATLAKEIIAGTEPLPNNEVLYFHTKSVRPSWANAFEVVTQTRAHIFYTK